MRTRGPDSDDQYSAPALEHGLEILAAFTRATPELNAPTLAANLGLPRSTVFRLLRALERMHYVVRCDDGRSYRLGASVLRLGFEYLASRGVVDIARPTVDDLSLQTGLPAHLVILDPPSVVYVLCSKPRSMLMGTVTVGTRLPMYATTFGRALLLQHDFAGFPAALVKTQLRAVSGAVPKTIGELRELLHDDQSRGFAVGEGFYEPNISTIAVPVRDDRNDIAAAIGVTVHSPRIDSGLAADGLVLSVVKAAARLATDLGYRGDAYATAEQHAGTFRRAPRNGRRSAATRSHGAPNRA